MKRIISDMVFTPSVKAIQERLGSRGSYTKMESKGGWSDTITEALSEFIAERNSLFVGTASADGRPYIQHRGGPKGFLKVLDERTLALADFAGNKQYISMGNLEENDRAFLFLMDYTHRRRIKIWGRARFVEDDEALLNAVADPGYAAKPQRVLVFSVEAWDVNCPQHIPQLFSEEDLDRRVRSLQQRVEELEQENANLRRLVA